MCAWPIMRVLFLNINNVSSNLMYLCLIFIWKIKNLDHRGGCVCLFSKWHASPVDCHWTPMPRTLPAMTRRRSAQRVSRIAQCFGEERKMATSNNPRKFSEKIALHNQKQAEETAAFEEVMKDLSITRAARVRVSRQTRTDQLKHGCCRIQPEMWLNHFCRPRVVIQR